jgi:hypothetical protein
MTLLVKSKRKGRDIVDVKPEASGLRYVGFSAHLSPTKPSGKDIDAAEPRR